MILTVHYVLTRQPTGTPRRAICPGEGLLGFPTAPSPIFLMPRVARAQGSFQLPHLHFQHPARFSSQNQPALRRLLSLTCQEFP